MSYFKKIRKKRILLSFILLMPILLLSIILFLITKGYLAYAINSVKFDPATAWTTYGFNQ